VVDHDRGGENTEREHADGVRDDHQPPAVQWSAATPAGSASSAAGSMRTNETTPVFAADPVTSRTRSGYAIAVDCVPMLESSCPVWSSMKSRFRRRGTAFTD
jgi:hypothetical protein